MRKRYQYEVEIVGTKLPIDRIPKSKKVLLGKFKSLSALNKYFKDKSTLWLEEGKEILPFKFSAYDFRTQENVIIPVNENNAYLLIRSVSDCDAVYWEEFVIKATRTNVKELAHA